jgi:hypothetical protein
VLRFIRVWDPAADGDVIAVLGCVEPDMRVVVRDHDIACACVDRAT